MYGQATGGILRFFGDLPDPRAHNVIHKLHDVLVIAICAVICGADGWAEVEVFGNSKLSWFKTFLELPGGIPSHDTFGRVFGKLDPDAFEKRFTAWVAAVAQCSGGKLIAIDGKSIRRSFEHAWDKSGMTHLVSAFVRENTMVFGQLAVEDKSNEIAAIPKLLGLLDLKGALVTVDAMGCQKNIAAQVVEAGGDYLLAVKDNQPALRRSIQGLMKEAVLDLSKSKRTQSDGSDGSVQCASVKTVDGDHGRIETRTVFVSDEIAALGEAGKEWKGLGSVVLVHSERDINGVVGSEDRFYISSVRGCDAARLADAVRGHWSVENQLHWQLDVSFGEDDRRIRKGYAAENYSRLCRLALNLLKRDKSVKIGVHGKRLKAGWDEHYLLRLLTT
jgi:predicted transposase YbfD/YdcC